MTYRAPVADILSSLRHAAGLDQAFADGACGDLALEDIEAILAEAG